MNLTHAAFNKYLILIKNYIRISRNIELNFVFVTDIRKISWLKLEHMSCFKQTKSVLRLIAFQQDISIMPNSIYIHHFLIIKFLFWVSKKRMLLIFEIKEQIKT